MFLHFGPGARTFLIALDKKTGNTNWQVEMPVTEPEERLDNFAGQKGKPMGSWSAPIIVKANGRDELKARRELEQSGQSRVDLLGGGWGEGGSRVELSGTLEPGHGDIETFEVRGGTEERLDDLAAEDGDGVDAGLRPGRGERGDRERDEDGNSEPPQSFSHGPPSIEGLF